MIPLLIRRALLLPVALLLVHFIGFAYALVAQGINARRHPFAAPLLDPQPVLPAYADYFPRLLRLEWGQLPQGRGALTTLLGDAIVASLGLLLVAFIASLVIGLLLGLYSVRTQPPGASPWLIPFSTVGLAMPSFYIGIVVVAAMIFYTFKTFRPPPLPYDGFGWDRHLLLPAAALAVRPTLQLAQVSSRLLSEELVRQYVIAQRSLGYSWRRIRWRTGLRNVLAPIVLTVTGSFRLLLSELVLIELLFRWPGIGQLLAQTLVPPHLSSDGGSFLFLNPAVLAAVLMVFTALFLLADFVTAILVRIVDPRLRAATGGAHHG